jgi:hypothetical protein
MIERGRYVVLLVALGSTGLRRKLLIAASAFVFAMLWALVGQASALSPLPASDYTVRSACKPPSAGRVGCLALELVPSTAAARARAHPLGIATSHAITAVRALEGAYGLRPQDLQSAYFPGEAPDAPASEPQTIALVDAYDDLDAEADLKTYDQEFGLPECTAGDGCFQQVNQNGEAGNLPFPSSEQAMLEAQSVCEADTSAPACKELEGAGEWSRETSLDIEVAHAVCQNCHIVLVEADNEESAGFEAAEDTAARPRSEGGVGATEISNSWAGEEPAADSEAFNHPGVVIVFAGGDRGYLNWDTSRAAAERYGIEIGVVDYPASSPHVVAVGGTRLTLGGPTQSWSDETVWNDGGDGCSASFPAQAWQLGVSDWSSVGCEDRRAVSDVSADADPYSGVAIYDSFTELEMADGGSRVVSTVPGWHTSGGTSLASPIVAAMFALAGGSHGVAYPAQTLYSHIGSAGLHDVVEGGSGACEAFYASGCSGSMHPLSLTDCGRGALICNAAAGYDGPSGVGTPDGIEAFRPTRVHTGGGPQAPITEACGGPIGAGGAQRVCGKLNPDSDAKAGYYFAYNKGTNCTGGKETPPAAEVQGQDIAVTGELTGLEAATEYAYCLIATNPSGETSGSALTFTTEPAAPKAPETRPASDITSDAATLEGKLGPQPIQTNWYFEYTVGFFSGCTGPGAKMTPEAQDTVLGEPGDEVSAAVELNPGTEYTVCLVAKNRIGFTTGSEVWFTTEGTRPPSETGVGKEKTEEKTKEVKTEPEKTPPTPPTDNPTVSTLTPVLIPTTPTTGGVSLDSSTITVQSNGTALVKLDCLGVASCQGKLTLTAKVAAKAKGRSKGDGKKGSVRAVSIGSAGFSIAGDETKTVKIALNAAGRGLLSADHGRCSASLALLELAPGPVNTQTKAVRLVQDKGVAGVS